MSETGEVELDLHQTPPFLRRFGLDNDADERAVKRAYARELKGIDQEQDPAGFQALREARDLSLRWLVYRAQRLAWEAQQGEGQAQGAPGADGAAQQPAVDAVAGAGQDAGPGSPVQAVGTQATGTQATGTQATGTQATGTQATGTQATGTQATGTQATETQATETQATETQSAGEPAVAQAGQAQAPEMLGAQVYADFSQALDRQLLSASQLQQMFERHLADERLMAVDAKDVFEWQLAQRLASGWRPGHETLIDLAAQTFGWNADRRRLLRFGRVGEVLDATMHELAAFEQQDVATRNELMDVIRSLRLYKEPDTQYPPERLMRAEFLAGRFPYLAGIITSSENLQAWRNTPAAAELKRRLQKQQEAESRQIRSVPAAGTRQKSGGATWGWAVFALMVILSSLAHMTSNMQPPPAPRPYGSGDPYVAAMVEENRRDRAQVAELAAVQMSDSNCGRVVQLSRRYPLGLGNPGDSAGDQLDRLIGACVHAKFWPKDADLAQQAAHASERVARRNGAMQLSSSQAMFPYAYGSQGAASTEKAATASAKRPPLTHDATPGEAGKKLLQQIQQMQPEMKPRAPQAAPAAEAAEESAASALTAGAVNTGGTAQALPDARGTGTQSILDTPRGRRGDPWYQSEVDRSRERLDPPGSRPPARPYGWDSSTPPRGTGDQ